MLGGSTKDSVDTRSDLQERLENIENISKITPYSKDSNLPEIKAWTEKQIYICLELDNNTFTHTNVLEKITDPQNVVLEYPVAQLFQKYGNRSHPLAVPGVKKDFRALLWKDWIERLSWKIPQKLAPRMGNITSDTRYEIKDTIGFSLIDPLLKNDFPQYLSDQLKERWFKEFSDPDASTLDKIISDKKTSKNYDKKSDFIYDIVVKKVPSWKSALALYRNWELFMATYASVGLNSRKTQVWQYKVLSKEPYKRSRKYDNAAMPEALNFYWGFYIHQWNVSWYPLSHWCVRIPGIFADVLYSSVKNSKSVDVFVSKNLYK